MSRLIVKFGAAPNDKAGDSARIGIQKVNSNFLELYSFLSGNEQADVLPTAIPISRGGTGASSADMARQMLGIGEAGTRGVGTEENDVMVIGTCGFGTDLAPNVLEVDGRTMSDYKSGELAYYGLDDVSAVTVATRTNSTKGQFGLRGLGKGKPVFVMRGIDETGTLTHWYEAKTQANTIETVNGNIKAATNSARITNQSCITQHAEALEFTRVNTGTYAIQNCVLNRNRWVKEVPLDEDGVPLLEVELTQLGTVLNVTVKKGGVPTDIPDDTWIDIHIT